MREKNNENLFCELLHHHSTLCILTTHWWVAWKQHHHYKLYSACWLLTTCWPHSKSFILIHSKFPLIYIHHEVRSAKDQFVLSWSFFFFPEKTNTENVNEYALTQLGKKAQQPMIPIEASNHSTTITIDFHPAVCSVLVCACVSKKEQQTDGKTGRQTRKMLRGQCWHRSCSRWSRVKKKTQHDGLHLPSNPSTT